MAIPQKTQLQNAIGRSRSRITKLSQEIEAFVADMGTNPDTDFTDEIVALHGQIEGEKRKLTAYESAILIAQEQTEEDRHHAREQEVLGQADAAYQLAAQRTSIAREMQSHLQQFLGLKQQFDAVNERCHHLVGSVAAYHFRNDPPDRRPYADGRTPQGLFTAIAEAVVAHAHDQPPVEASEWKEQHIRQMVQPWLPQPEEVSHE